MIDFVRLCYYSQSFAEYLRKHPMLIPVKKEIKRTFGLKETFRYKGMFFIVYQSGRVIIEGSLHKYWNNGSHNFNDFAYEDLLLTIEDLSNNFTPFILTGIIQNIECGLNINLPFLCQEYLQQVITLKGKNPTEKHPIVRNDLKGFRKGYHFQKSFYGLKIYDKGKQYNRLESIVRHEFKTFKTQIIEKIGLNTLYDLTDATKLADLSLKLLETYKNTIVAEIVDVKKLSRQNERIYTECCNPSNWTNWNRDKRCKRLKQFNQILQLYGESDIKAIVLDLLTLKRLELLAIAPKKVDIITKMLNNFNSKKK